MDTGDGHQQYRQIWKRKRMGQNPFPVFYFTDLSHSSGHCEAQTSVQDFECVSQLPAH